MNAEADSASPAQELDNTRKRKTWLLGLALLVVVGGGAVWAWQALYGPWAVASPPR